MDVGKGFYCAWMKEKSFSDESNAKTKDSENPDRIHATDLVTEDESFLRLLTP